MVVNFLRKLSVVGGWTVAGLLALAMAASSGVAAQTTFSRIVVFGDSLSAGYGLSQGSGWVSLMEQRLQREKTRL